MESIAPLLVTEAEPGTVYDVAILGGGPAGASAALYAARAKLQTVVLDKGTAAGALGATPLIVNYPGVPEPLSGAELVRRMRAQAESFGARFVTTSVVGVSLREEPRQIWTADGLFLARSVIIATGSMGRKAKVPGEDRLVGRGVSYCATCDGAFFAGKDVAVVGSDEEAVTEAIFLTRYVRRLWLVAGGRALKAEPQMVAELESLPQVTVLYGRRLVAVEGEQRVSGLVLASPGGEERLAVDGVFIYLKGGSPSTEFLQGEVALAPDGCVQVDEWRQTSLPGVFAVGDVTCRELKQAVIAAADGALAAMAADRYVHRRAHVRQSR